MVNWNRIELRCAVAIFYFHRVVGYWVREGVFFCTLFYAFFLVYLYTTCILSRSLCAFINTISYYLYIYKMYNNV